MFRVWSVWGRGLDGVQGLGLGGFSGLRVSHGGGVVGLRAFVLGFRI